MILGRVRSAEAGLKRTGAEINLVDTVNAA